MLESNAAGLQKLIEGKYSYNVMFFKSGGITARKALSWILMTSHIGFSRSGAYINPCEPESCRGF